MRSSYSSRGPLLALALLLLLGGCSATKVREVWRDDGYQGRPKSVMIVAVAGKATVQRTFESGFARHLKEHGITVTESFRVLSEGAGPEGDAGRDAVLSAIKERGIDAVLLTRVTGRRSDSRYIPGMTITSGFGYPYGSYGAWGGYSMVVASTAPSAPTTQGYSYETKFLDIETHLFDVRTEKLVWAARSEVRLSGTALEEIGPYIDRISRILLREGFLR